MTTTRDERVSAIETYFDSIDKSNPTPTQKTVLYVYTAMGILDNGGLAYFLSEDFEGQKAHEAIAEEFRRIGLDDVCTAILAAISLFPGRRLQESTAQRAHTLNNETVAKELELLDATILPLSKRCEDTLFNIIRASSN